MRIARDPPPESGPSQGPRPLSSVLVDTSAWLDYFRGKGPAEAIVDRLLRAGDLCTHGLIKAEVLSGARNEKEFHRLAEGLDALPLLSDPPNLWDLVGQARYQLARKGHQCAIADLVIAVNAHFFGKYLYSLDSDFRRIQTVIPFRPYPRPG